MEQTKLFNVQNKVVVVTGGGRGVGQCIAEGFVTNGAKVYITGRKKEALEETCNKLNKLGKGKCLAIPGDLSDPKGLESVIEELKQKEKAIHVLVNNAGANWGSDLDSITPASYDRVMNLNVKSLLFITLALRAQLQAAGTEADPARVINIGSIQGIIVGRNTPVYDASKAAVHHLTKALAGQLAPLNILVNAIALGFYETSMTKGSIAALGKDNAYSQVPVGRSGSPTEVAGTCIYLASPASNYVVGATLIMDGGLIASKSAL